MNHTKSSDNLIRSKSPVSKKFAFGCNYAEKIDNKNTKNQISTDKTKKLNLKGNKPTEEMSTPSQERINGFQNSTSSGFGKLSADKHHSQQFKKVHVASGSVNNQDNQKQKP